jgi:phage terminase small subunit
MENRRLTAKQKKFADAYIKTGNASLAAEEAGYSKKTARFIGSENLTKPNIKSYIDKKMKEIEDKQIAKAEEVLKYLTKIIRDEESEEVIVVESIGDFMSKARKIDKAISAKDKIRAAELIGRRYGIFKDAIDINEPINITIKRKGD